MYCLKIFQGVTSVGLAALRQAMQVIPKACANPILLMGHCRSFHLSGIIRSALVFKGKFDDNALWQMLELV